MKLSLAVAAAVMACFGAALPADSNLADRSLLAPRASNSKVSGLQFNIDGTTGYFAGTNSYWIGFLQNSSDVDLVMSHLQTSGLKILRVWGFNDITTSSADVWFQSLVPGAAAVINTGTNGLQRLDTVVKSAENHGIKLIINFVNYWDDYGGFAAYNSWAGVTTKTDWYNNTQIQTQYKAYIKAVVSRYSTSTAIFAWELANEVRCPSCSTDVIYNWATGISAYIKSLDSTHMVTLGDEGFMDGGGDGAYPFTKGEGVDFVKNLKIADLDFGTFHLYPNAWGTTVDWGNLWITEHAKACVAANKPCLFEEYGYPSDHVAIETPWQVTALNSTGLAGDLFWQHGDVLSTGKTSDDTNTIYYGSTEWDGLVVAQQARIAAKNAGTNVSSSVTSVKATSTSTKASSTSTKASTTSTKASTTTTKASTTTKAATTTAAATPTGTAVPKWGQCGGDNWTGSKVCVSGTTCTFSNQWYSQCL